MDDEPGEDVEPVESEGQRRWRALVEDLFVALLGVGVSLAIPGTGGAVAAAATQALPSAWAVATRGARERAERVVEDGGLGAGLDAESFARWVAQDPRHAGLLLAAVEAAARSVAEENVRALSRVLAEGARDDARVDEDTLLAQVLGRLRPSHVQVLRLLVEGEGPGHHGRKVWDLSPDAAHVLRRLPHLGMSAVPLLAALVAEGCAVSDGGVQHEASRYQATGFGALCLWALRPAGQAGPRPVPPEDPWRS